MFTVRQRDRLRKRVLELARADRRVVAGAAVGSLALGEGDRWSDLDLTFAVVDDAALLPVLEQWTQTLIDEFSALRLFDLPSGASIYRVFLMPGCLQFDLSFTPAAHFGASGPKFKLLFGQAVDRPYAQPPGAGELFGYAVHHALRARFCIERGRPWQAEYWLSATRDYALSLACLRRGLPAVHGRGFDQLPAQVREGFLPALAGSLERAELLRALAAAIENLLREADAAGQLPGNVAAELRALTADWQP